MILYPKGVEASEIVTEERPSKTIIKNKIKALVKEPMSYEDIVKEVQSDLSVTNDEVYQCILLVKEEWHPEPEEPEEPKEPFEM